MLTIRWLKCQGGQGQSDVWCGLHTVKLDTVKENGVYIIWHGGDKPKVVYVGQGAPISDRLTAHRTDARIQKYNDKGLYVTWASVPADKRDGVERYLADTWNPLVGDVHPDAIPIEVNSPWAA